MEDLALLEETKRADALDGFAKVEAAAVVGRRERLEEDLQEGAVGAEAEMREDLVGRDEAVSVGVDRFEVAHPALELRLRDGEELDRVLERVVLVLVPVLGVLARFFETLEEFFLARRGELVVRPPLELLSRLLELLEHGRLALELGRGVSIDLFDPKRNVAKGLVPKVGERRFELGVAVPRSGRPRPCSCTRRRER